MNKTVQSKSNPRTPVSQSKYQQNATSQYQQSYNSLKNQKGLSGDQIPQPQYNETQMRNCPENRDIYQPLKQLHNLNGGSMGMGGILEDEALKQKQFSVQMSGSASNLQDIQSLQIKCQNVNKQSLHKNNSYISLQNTSKSKQTIQNKGSQDNLQKENKQNSMISGKSSNIGSIVNISNYTSEQIQKGTSINMNAPKFQLQPNQESNQLFSELIGLQSHQPYQQDSNLTDCENIQTYNYLLHQSEPNIFLKRHTPIQLDVPKKKDSMNQGLIDSQDCSPLLKNKQFSHQNLQFIQRNYKENNATKTPIRKPNTSNTSKVSLNVTPSSHSVISHDNQKTNSKSNQKSTLKIIQDSSSFNSYLQQQKQSSNINNQLDLQAKYGSFYSQNGVQNQQKSNIASFYTNQNSNQSQTINPLTSISIQSAQSQNSNNQVTNASQQNQVEQINPTEMYEKQFYTTQNKMANYNIEHKENSMQNLEGKLIHQMSVDVQLLQLNKYTTTCDSQTSRNQQPKPNLQIESNTIIQNTNIQMQSKQQKEVSPLKKYTSSITQEEDYSVPQELQNSFQMNKNISKLQNLTTVRASDIDLLRHTDKITTSHQNIQRTNSLSLASHQAQSEIEKQFSKISNKNTNNTIIKNNIINNISNNNNNIINNISNQNLEKNMHLKKDQSNKMNATTQQKNIVSGKENRREVTLIIQNTPQQYSNPFFNPKNIAHQNGNESYWQFNRQSIDSCLDATTKNIPLPFISQEKQTKLTMQHKNKTHRRNCNCDQDLDQIDSCSRISGWLGSQKEQIQINQNLFFSQDSSEFDNKMLCQIQKDVNRTYQNYEFFWNPQVQQTIQQILQKFTKLYPEVGYVQGMNLIVGYLIWHADEASAFELLIKITRILHLNELLKAGFPDLQKHLKTIEVVMILNCPQIYQILNKYDLHPSMFISEWIIVLLTDIVPLEYSVNLSLKHLIFIIYIIFQKYLVLDGIINNGWIFFYKAVINLMKQLLKVIENLDDQSEILYVLKSVRQRQKEYNINWQQLLTMKEPFISIDFILQIQNHLNQNAIQ